MMPDLISNNLNNESGFSSVVFIKINNVVKEEEIKESKQDPSKLEIEIFNHSDKDHLQKEADVILEEKKEENNQQENFHVVEESQREKKKKLKLQKKEKCQLLHNFLVYSLLKKENRLKYNYYFINQ